MYWATFGHHDRTTEKGLQPFYKRTLRKYYNKQISVLHVQITANARNDFVKQIQ